MMAAVLLAAAGQAPAQEPPAAAEWPCWRGPTGGGASPDCGLDLVRDPRDLRLVWKSDEQDIPNGWMHPNGRGNIGIAGGYGGPMVYGGRVYLAWYVPSGKVVDKDALNAAKDKRPEKWLTDADDVLLCLDAATGKTLWKAVMQDRGQSHQLHMHCPLSGPVAAEGKVYWLGSGGWVHCVDAATGRPLWQSRLGKVANAVSAWKEAGKVMLSEAGRRLPGVNKCCFNSCPAVADGVVACNDYSDYAGSRGNGEALCHGLAAFDANTGGELWSLPDAIGHITSPVVWTHKGKRYFISAGPRRAVAVEPQSGKVVWEIRAPQVAPSAMAAEVPGGRMVTPALTLGGTPAVSEDLLVLNGTFVKHGSHQKPYSWEAGLTCWRITPAGAEKLWHLPAEQSPYNPISPLIYRPCAYAVCGKMLCIDAGTGKVLGSAAAGGNHGSPVASDGLIFREGAMLQTGPGDFKALGRLAVPWEPFTTAAIAEGRLYVRGPKGPGGSLHTRARDAVYCYDLRKAGEQ